MKRLARLPAWFWIALALCQGGRGLVAATSENPYLGIAGRNVFGLKPPRPQPKKTAQAPLARVKVAGITTMLVTQAIGRVKRDGQPELKRLKRRLEQVYESADGEVEV